jgi:branched-chain amino acid transport system ATP-binding protein
VEKLQELVLDLVRRRGITVAVIEHNMAFVSQVARVTYVLRSGTVHDSGPTDDVLNRPENRELCIGL